jgi:hypothetical protein
MPCIAGYGVGQDALLLAQGIDSPKTYSEGEVMLGATLNSVTKGADVKAYGGFGFGLGANLPVALTDIGRLYGSIACAISIGSKPQNTSFDLQTLQIPLGAMFKIGEDVEGGKRFIGGAIGSGVSLSLGPFISDGVSVRPYVLADAILALFTRGSLKIRYYSVIGSHIGDDSSKVTTHSLYLIASTEW